MIQLVMTFFGWEAVWSLGGNGLVPWYLGWTRKHVFVGTWTGPDHDLLCVKACTTVADAERWLSPAGYTILDACVRAIWLRAIGGRRPRAPEGPPELADIVFEPFDAGADHHESPARERDHADTVRLLSLVIVILLGSLFGRSHHGLPAP